MKKRVISTLLVGAMVFSLAGCGTKQEAEPEAPAPAEKRIAGIAAAAGTAPPAAAAERSEIGCPVQRNM